MPRHSEKETWEHAVQCRNTTSMVEEFVLELCKDLKKIQAVGISNEELRSLIENIRTCLRQHTECLETDQKEIGMKYLFRGFSIKSWNGACVNVNTCTA